VDSVLVKPAGGGMNPSLFSLFDIQSVLKDTTPITPTKFFHHENVTTEAKKMTS